MDNKTNQPSFNELLPSSVADLASLLGGAPLEDLPQWTAGLIGAAPERGEHVAEPLVEWDKPENLAWARDYLTEDAPPAIQGEGGEQETFKVAAELRDHGIGELMALELMLEIYNERCNPPWEVDGEHGLAKKINNAYRYASQGAPGHATPEAQFGADPPEPDAEADKRAAESAARHGKKEEKKQPPPKTATTDDFYAYLPEHLYLYVPTRTLWPAATINSIFGKGASKFLDRTKPCQQMTWCPGKEMIVKDRLVVEGGWIKKQGANCFNKYLPPKLINGDPDKAGPWRKHLEKIFGEDARHIERWLAYRVQHPDIKINHALVIGSGKQGIGKDTTLEPVKRAVGPWNFKDVSAEQALDPKFNPFLESVILRINEARDLGDKDRFAFYDHTKTWMASPPDVISVADKFIRAHPVFNLTGTIITTNHKTDGLYLPAEDRRHYVAWTDVQPEDFEDGYWRTIWNWYADGGIEHAAAYLATLDLHDFDPKAPPLKTAAFWDIVNANRAPEDAELSDVLDRLGDPLGLGEIERPAALTLDQITQAAGADDYGGFYQWITDRKNRRLVPHRMEKCGYAPIRNEHDKHDGQWRIGGKRKVIYGATRLPFAERVKAAQALVEREHRRAARAAARKAGTRQ